MKEKTRGAGGKSTYLGEPDIGGHDLLPLMLQERREATAKASSPVGLPNRPRSPPQLPGLGTSRRVGTNMNTFWLC